LKNAAFLLAQPAGNFYFVQMKGIILAGGAG